jgi:hypothetical protein
LFFISLFHSFSRASTYIFTNSFYSKFFYCYFYLYPCHTVEDKRSHKTGRAFQILETGNLSCLIEIDYLKILRCVSFVSKMANFDWQRRMSYWYIREKNPVSPVKSGIQFSCYLFIYFIHLVRYVSLAFPYRIKYIQSCVKVPLIEKTSGSACFLFKFDRGNRWRPFTYGYSFFPLLFPARLLIFSSFPFHSIYLFNRKKEILSLTTK